MIEKIKKNKVVITLLILIIVSNLFTIAFFVSGQKDPNMRINGNDTPATNIMNDSPGSSWNGDVTNNNPIVESKVIKSPTKVPIYGTVSRQWYTCERCGASDGMLQTYAFDALYHAECGGKVTVTTYEEQVIKGYEWK